MLNHWKHPPQRRGDWEAKLVAYIDRVRRRRHAYGRHDCVIFCAGATEAMTGRDYAEGHRRRYSDAVGAMRYLRSLGFSSAEELLDSLFEEVPVGFAQRGDIVLADGIPGVCMGADGLFIGETEDGAAHGLGVVPRGDWSKAWKVGRP